MSTESPEPQVFQATWLDLLPRFLGCSLAMMAWFALQASGWLVGIVFKSHVPGIVAAIIGLTILPHFLSSLVALIVPGRRRLVIDQNGLSFTHGMTRYAGTWSQCGTITLRRSFLRRPVLRMSGAVTARPILWRLLEWPLYLVTWLILMLIALLINSLAASAIDFPETDDCSRIPGFFYRGKEGDRLLAALAQYTEILTPASPALPQ